MAQVDSRRKKATAQLPSWKHDRVTSADPTLRSLSRRSFLSMGMAVLVGAPARAESALVHSAAAFVDSVGVNTHISSEPYASRFPFVAEMLGASGIRHLRDELRPTNNLDHWRTLFTRHGIKSHLLVSPVTNTVPEMMTYLDALGVDLVSAIEGQNEGDSDWFMSQPQARGDWSTVVVAYQKEVFNALRSVYSAATLPIVSPTVLNWKPANMRLIRGAAEFCDIVAIHSYVQRAEEPETGADYAALSWYLRNMRDAFKPGASVMATETGYNNVIKPSGKAVSETAAAIYIPRLLLHNFSRGVKRTFLYQFLDGGSDPSEWEHHFGLIRDDNTLKPAFHSAAMLLGALSDTGTAQSASAELKFVKVLADASTKVRSLQLRKSDGSLVIALWLPVSCWDVPSSADISVSPRHVAVAFDRPVARAEMLVLGEGNT